MSDLPLTSATDFVSYLESQLEKHDEERSLLIEQMNNLKSNFRQISDFREELRTVSWRRDQLTHDLMEEKLVVQEEREKVARLLDENAVLQAQCDDDRVKISSLIGLCKGEFVSGAGGGNGASMYAERHLHIDPRNAFDARKHQEKVDSDKVARGGFDCLPTGHLPLRKDATPSSRGPLRPKSALPTATTMSLRNVVTDFANQHVHRGDTCGSSALAMHSPSRLSTPAPTNTTSTSLQQYGMVDPRGVVCRGGGVEGGGVGGAVEMALQTPVGSQLIAALSAESHDLKQLLDEQRKMYEQDRTRRMQAEQLRVDRYIDSDRKQLKVIKQLEDDIQVAVKELCLYRHQQQIIERSLRGEIEMLKVQCLETKRDLTQQNSRETYELALALELATHKNEGAVTKLKSELVGKRQMHLKEREDLQQLVVSLQAENSDLTAKLDQEKKMRRRGEERFSLEREGMRSEVMQLKQHLRAMEKRMYFTHIKQESNATSSAQLLASLVTDQYTQQLANEQNIAADDADSNMDGAAHHHNHNRHHGGGIVAVAKPKRKLRTTSTATKNRSSSKRRPLTTHVCNGAGDGSRHGSSSCPACGAIEEHARVVSAQKERDTRRGEPLSNTHLHNPNY